MTLVFLTVDTECSLGGALEDSRRQAVPVERAILGKIGDHSYGTPLIMEILEESQLRATFFLEVLSAPLVGGQELAEASRQIVERGHDIQLHLHPVYHFYQQLARGMLARDQLPRFPDLIGSLPPDVQSALLEQGHSLFRKIVGRSPIAFRAGCYGASSATLAILQPLGVLYDSSFNAAYLGRNCLMDGRRELNHPWLESGVWEVPVTNFETGAWRLRGLKPLEISAVSFREICAVLEYAARNDLEAVTLVLHSFSLLKHRDVQFSELRPDQIVIRRFRALCRYLGKHSSEFRVVTFSERPRFASPSEAVPVPDLGSWMPLCRKVVQGLNRIHWV
jgi:peptidoglycan/xylan/chitin deacetylase (PgdA/CDA1 family)